MQLVWDANGNFARPFFFRKAAQKHEWTATRLALKMVQRETPTTTEVSIQSATWRDLRPLIRIEKICFGRDSWPWPELLAALTFPGTVRLKLEIDDRLVGFVIGDRRGRKDLGWVASIGVHPDFRRRGYGRQLLEACERALGTRRVRLSLRRTNGAALKLYDHAGYSQVEVWPRYYRDGEDALVMERIAAE